MDRPPGFRPDWRVITQWSALMVFQHLCPLLLLLHYVREIFRDPICFAIVLAYFIYRIYEWDLRRPALNIVNVSDVVKQTSGYTNLFVHLSSHCDSFAAHRVPSRKKIFWLGVRSRQLQLCWDPQWRVLSFEGLKVCLLNSASVECLLLTPRRPVRSFPVTSHPATS